MYTGKLVFSQLTEHLPLPAFRQCVTRYRGNHKIKSFSCLDQFLSMMFAQLTYRESLRDIETTLRAHSTKLYHMGIRGGISRNTLANANQARDWRIYADFTSTLIQIARDLYSNEKLALDLEQTVYAFDSSTIDLCLSVFPWAPFRRTKAGIKLHTLLDLRGNIPSFIAISDAKLNDVKALDLLTSEPGAFYIMDRAYLDFERLYRFQLAGSFFVIRAKSNTKMRRLHSRPVDKTTGLRCDQTVSLTGVNTALRYPQHLRRIKFIDPATNKELVFLTNNFALSAFTITELYRNRWYVELFFKWIKQHLRIKAFFGTTENAVKSQIWIAISTYVLVAIVKKRLNINESLYSLLQVLSLTLFERVHINQLLNHAPGKYTDLENAKQLNLFD
jgi:hypothetical protein